MEFIELARNRCSVRAYRSDPVEEAKLTTVLEAARLAPTAANRQPFRVVVIRTTGREAELKTIYPRPFFLQAPLVLAVCMLPGEAWVRVRDGMNAAVIDAAIVMDHMVLAAASLGLGTCWICAFDPLAAQTALELPEGVEPVAFTPLGYPDEGPGEKKRRPLSDLVIWDKW